MASGFMASPTTYLINFWACQALSALNKKDIPAFISLNHQQPSKNKLFWGCVSPQLTTTKFSVDSALGILELWNQMKEFTALHVWIPDARQN